ncbi:Uncharacterised protein [Mycobacteroides abscessus subsp. massiliense]|nr:Uncharacterised protein [Mycobacteroides abscessus subsp. massiliense]
MLSGKVDGTAPPDIPDDLQELPRAFVALIVSEPIAETSLFGVVSAADDVEEQPAVGEALQSRRLLCGKRRRNHSRPRELPSL